MLGRLASLVRVLVVLVALGSLAVAAVPVVRHLGGRSEVPAPPPAPVLASTDEPPPPNLVPILDLAPFGMVEAPPAAEEPVGETTLDLVLQGVVLQDDPDASTAFISHDGGTMGYHPGDAVADRGRLVDVAADHVVLEVGGNIQTLSFPDPAGDAGMDPEADFAAEPDFGFVPEPDSGPEADPDPADPLPSEGAAALSGPERLRQMVAAQTQEDAGGEEEAYDLPEEGDDPEPPPPDASGTEEPQTVEDQIDLWRERIRANPQEVLDSLGLIPDADGYRIAEQHDGDMDLAGLQAGDVITSVNGQAVGDVERDRQLFDVVVTSGQARLEVMRDGRVLVLTFPLQ